MSVMDTENVPFVISEQNLKCGKDESERERQSGVTKKETPRVSVE